MLKLNRKVNESIIISTPTGELIKIQLCSSSRSHSKIGVEAPSDYKILRDELIDEHEFQTTAQHL